MRLTTASLLYWRAGGLLLLPLVAVCFGIWFYYLRIRGQLMLEMRQAEGWLSELEQQPGIAVETFYSEERNEGLMETLRKDLGVLKALTVVAPLLGLLGTVIGMISTFQAVSASGGDTAHRVAEGVSRALITTQAGLVVALPGVFGQSNLRVLLSRLQVRLGALKLHYYERFSEEGV